MFKMHGLTFGQAAEQSANLPFICNKSQREREPAKRCKRTRPQYHINCLGFVFFFFFKFLIISIYSLLSSLLILRAMKSQPRCFQELELAHLHPLLPPSCKQLASTNQSLHFKCHHRLLFCVSSSQSVCSRRRWMLEPARQALWLEVCPKG